MRKIRKIGLSLVIAVVLTLGLALPALAQNPTVTITMSAKILLITNTMATWGVGALTANQAAVYFSVNNSPDVDYSMITNTGNVEVDISIHGTNAIEVGPPSTYNWTLASVAGDKIFSLYANSELTPTVYDVEVKTSAYSNLIVNLVEDDTYVWSMKLTPPTVFDAADDGDDKVSTVTLVASDST